MSWTLIDCPTTTVAWTLIELLFIAILTSSNQLHYIAPYYN